MPTSGYILVVILGLAFALSEIFQYIRRRNIPQLVIVLLCIGAYFAVVFYFLYPASALQPKGQQSDFRLWATFAALYVFIIVGMFADWAFSWLNKTSTQRQKSFDWSGIVRPLCISPLVLMATLAAFQNANIDLTRLGIPWFMFLLTAFEKGFLWRHYMKGSTQKTTL